MTQEFRIILFFFGMIILFPILFGLAYLLWNMNYLAALLLLFIGLSTDILVSLKLIDETLNHT